MKCGACKFDDDQEKVTREYARDQLKHLSGSERKIMKYMDALLVKADDPVPEWIELPRAGQLRLFACPVCKTVRIPD